MKNRRRDPVLIIGAHRSGTTATAHALEILGLQIGQDLDSHREPRRLQKLHEEYLHRLGAAWYKPRPFLQQMGSAKARKACTDYLRENISRDFARIFGYRPTPKGMWLRSKLKRGTRWGWKEPRTTLFAKAWLEIFPDARIVHVHRDPSAVAASIRERELKFQAAGDPPTGKLEDLDHCRQLVQDYVRAGDELSTFPNYRPVRFEEIQANPSATLEQLAQFCRLRFTRRQLARAAASIRPRR